MVSRQSPGVRVPLLGALGLSLRERIAAAEPESTSDRMSAATQNTVKERSASCEPKRFGARTWRRLGALAAGRRTSLTVLGTLIALGVLALVLAGRWGQFAGAAVGAPWWALTAAAVIQLGSLLARTEAWNICVHAAGGTVERRRLYRAAGVGYLGNTVNGELGFAARVASLRRAAPRESPKALVLAATEVPIVLMELALATLFSFTLIAPLSLPWWTPLVGFCAVLAIVAGLARLAQRHPSGWWRGLAALSEPRTRVRVAVFVVLAVCGQVARNWLMLHASGVHASVLDAAAVLIAVAALGVLPIGPGVGAGAMVLILGSTGVAGATAAGVLLTATGTVGAVAYGGWALADRFWATRRTRLPLPAPGRPGQLQRWRRETRPGLSASQRARELPAGSRAPRPRRADLRDLDVLPRRDGIMDGMRGPSPQAQKRYHVTTFGCQMNEHDSERMKGMLESLGYREVPARGEADLILFNTCSIREKADDRFVAHLGEAKRLKAEDPGRIVGVGGCWAQSVKEEVFSRFPFVDVAFGPGQVHKLAEFLTSDSLTAQGFFEFEGFTGHLPAKRAREFQAWVQISVGCNCVCSYCIVPSTRGREVSRPADELVAEVRQLAADGVREVTLLGQNVNSYGRDLPRERRVTFAELLAELDEIPAIERIRYTSPHPKDMRADVIKAHAELRSLCEHIHLPLQSGSSAVLKRMRRTYTRERYLDRVAMIREHVPDCAPHHRHHRGLPGRDGG